jgi:hypothetical protein
LADSVESARHVLLQDNPTYKRLVSFVTEIVEDKITDFQLDECDLTLRDINSIADAFVRVLSGMYHTRIEYPKGEEVEDVGAGKMPLLPAGDSATQGLENLDQRNSDSTPSNPREEQNGGENR